MNCKYCNAQLEEGVTLCPVCGKEQEMTEEIPAEAAAPVEETAAAEDTVGTEETAAAEEAAETEESAPAEGAEPAAQTEIKEGIKATPGRIAAAVVAVILVIAMLAALIAGGLRTQEPEPTMPATETEAPVVIPFDGDATSPLCKASYTVSDEAAIAAADTVVATMGDRVLTNGELQAYYWQEIFLFLQEYGNYVDYIGLDLNAPLDEQLTELGETSMSWQQFFLDCAVYSWQNYQALALEAEATGYELAEELQSELDGLPEELEASATESGLASADELVQNNVGAGCSLKHYLSYVQTYYLGMSYYSDYCDSIAPSADEIEAYFTENEANYAESGITRESGKYVDVRHVLLQPEGGETGEDGYPVFTDEAWENCRLKAEEIYGRWLEGDLSEDSFAELAREYSEDGNASTGGLYEDVYEGQMVEAFENWCFDEARVAGDHGLVKTQYGYHIMFFSGSRDIWYANAEYDLISEIAYAVVPALNEKYPARVDYSAVVLSPVEFN